MPCKWVEARVGEAREALEGRDVEEHEQAAEAADDDEKRQPAREPASAPTPPRSAAERAHRGNQRGNPGNEDGYRQREVLSVQPRPRRQGILANLRAQEDEARENHGAQADEPSGRLGHSRRGGRRSSVPSSVPDTHKSFESVASLQSLRCTLEPSPFGFGTKDGSPGKMIVGKMISQDRVRVGIILPSII